MELQLTRDIEEFAASAGGFLAERLENNQLATTVIKARRGAYGGGDPLFAYGRDASGRVRYAALRTPPWPMLTSTAEVLEADELLERWLAEDPGLPGVLGESRAAGSIAGAWERAGGGGARLSMRTVLQTTSAVIDPVRPAAGRLRLAEAAERELLLEWERCFLRDAQIAVSASVERLTDSRLAEGAQFLWDRGGPVSTIVISPEVAGTVRIGPVYTPPEYRRNGYATSAVAAVCRRVLGSGAERCALFTDLDNPTSQKIYAEVGFLPVADWAEYSFI